MWGRTSLNSFFWAERWPWLRRETFRTRTPTSFWRFWLRTTPPVIPSKKKKNTDATRVAAGLTRVTYDLCNWCSNHHYLDRDLDLEEDDDLELDELLPRFLLFLLCLLSDDRDLLLSEELLEESEFRLLLKCFNIQQDGSYFMKARTITTANYLLYAQWSYLKNWRNLGIKA